MTLGALSITELWSRLSSNRLIIDMAPFSVRIRSTEPALARDLRLLYAEFPVLPEDEFADFHVAVARDGAIRRWIRPQVRFFLDDVASFVPLKLDHAMASMEWGLNWCVASHCHQYLVIHAAVVEKHGAAVLLPAPPGSGKSTLCAALVLRGWRLLSDELALYDPATHQVYGMARPINLKNRSIDVIRAFEPSVLMTEPVRDTSKGTVALLQPPSASVRRAREPAQARHIVFPQFTPDASAGLAGMGKARACMAIAEQSFNYDVLGRSGFEAVTAMVDRCSCHALSYGSLDQALCIVDALLPSAAT